MRRVHIAGVFAIVLALAIPASGEDGGRFKTMLSAGLTLTDGNTESLQTHSSLVAEGERDTLGSVHLGLEGFYGESTVDGRKETTAENARAFASAKKTITPRTYASLDTAAFYDDIARIDYRVNLGPGYGYYLLKSEQTSLSLDIGPSYLWERVARTRDDYMVLRIGERFVRALSDTARVWQSVEYLPKADEFSNYLLNSELGVEAALNSRLNIRLVLRDQYDSTPAEGLKKNDLSLIAGISVSL